MNHEVLRAVANASAANTHHFVSREEGGPLLEAGFIVVNKEIREGDKVAAKITDVGVAHLHTLNGATEAKNHTPSMSGFAVHSGGIELPKATRGFKKGHAGGGAPSKYPFDTMEIGQFFFVADTAVKNGNAIKTLGSAAGSANQRFATGTGEYEKVQRAKRDTDHKAIKGADGKNIMEEVTVEKKVYNRKFIVRPVKANTAYGNFTAPADGAVVFREH